MKNDLEESEERKDPGDASEALGEALSPLRMAPPREPPPENACQSPCSKPIPYS